MNNQTVLKSNCSCTFDRNLYCYCVCERITEIPTFTEEENKIRNFKLISIELSTILVQLLQSVFQVYSLKIKNLKKVWGEDSAGNKK